MIPGLGEHSYYMGAKLAGDFSEEEGAALIAEIITTLQMTPAYEHVLHRFPIPVKDAEGNETLRGGRGYTYFQSITESYITLDTWPERGHADLLICSCIPFEAHVVLFALRGYHILSAFAQTL